MMKCFICGLAAGMVAGAMVVYATMPRRRRCRVRAAASNVLHNMGDAMDHAGKMMYR